MNNKELYIKASELIGKDKLEVKTKAFLLRIINKAEAEVQNLTAGELKKKQAVLILSDLNEVCHTHFRPVTGNISLIYARMAEGYTVDDFKLVHRHKAGQWLADQKFRSYLRPETLYRPTHFASYLNEAEQKKQGLPANVTPERNWKDNKTLQELVDNRSGLDIPDDVRKLFGVYYIAKQQKDTESIKQIEERYQELRRLHG